MEQNLVIGIDVGGQTTKCGVVDARGTVLAQTVIRSDSYTTVEPYIEELAAALKKPLTFLGEELVRFLSPRCLPKRWTASL